MVILHVIFSIHVLLLKLKL